MKSDLGGVLRLLLWFNVSSRRAGCSSLMWEIIEGKVKWVSLLPKTSVESRRIKKRKKWGRSSWTYLRISSCGIN